MKRSNSHIIKCIILIIFNILGVSSYAFAAELPPAVREALRRANIPVSSIGIVVREVNAAAPLIQINATQAMNPASTMKLLTTYAALELLGPAYTWKTEAYMDGKLENGSLRGDLVIKGYGNPKMNSDQLWLWLHELRNRGLRDIRGDLILDHSAFAPQETDPAAFDNDPERAYNVNPDALLLNFNATRLHFIPSDGKVNVYIEPTLDGITVDNRLAFKMQNHCGVWDRNIHVQLLGNTIRVQGSYPASCGERNKAVNLLPHTLYFDAVFRSLWKEMGGTLSGSTRDGVTPASAMLLSTHYSQPLSEIIRDINKYSNNVMARQLFLSLSLNSWHDNTATPNKGALKISAPPLLNQLLKEEATNEYQREFRANETPAINIPGSAMPADNAQASSFLPPASKELSEKILRDWVAKKGFDFPELVLENGAGLSRIERLSPYNLSLLLQDIQLNPYSAEIEASLPIIGVDGTMKKRHDNCAVTAHAHLKTGSLEGVKSIAGYLQSRSGKQWILVFIINHPNAAQGQQAQDALIEWLEESH